MIIRIRAATGMCRVNVEPSDPAKSLFEQASTELKLSSAPFKLAKNPNGSEEIEITDRSIEATGLKHGDMIHLIVEPSSRSAESTPDIDEVDRVLDSKDGMVIRKRDPQFCMHADGMACIHCLPLDPFDEAVLNGSSPPIKFLSFHSYLRQLRQGNTATGLINLQELRCSVKKSCNQCPGWPNGVCTQCLPSAVRLSRQKFRHVDLLSFEFSDSVEHFIKFWRASGNQRIGHLYGRYEEYPFDGKHGVPLGIKASVTAIYEPPQDGSPTGVELLEDPHAETVARVAKLLGLVQVGWIFTDLEGAADGTVKYKRFTSAETSVLSSAEVIYAAMQQCDFPNYVANKYSSTGTFGSKFVTCVVSGGVDNQVVLKGYQASNDAMALARAECLVPSVHRMNEVCVRQSDKDHYVPEVLYDEKNEYGQVVTKKADPTIPLEFLFVGMEATFSTGQSSAITGVEPFVVENRAVIGELQGLGSLQRHLAQQGSLLSKMSDVHLLWYLASQDIVPLMEELPTVIDAIKNRKADVVEEWASRTPQWQTLQMLMQFSEEQ